MAEHPPLFTEEFRIKDQRENIKGVAVTNYDPAEPQQDAPLHTVVVGNGAFGNIRTFGTIVRSYLRAAAQAGQPTRAITYFDPWFGTGTYAEDNRTARLDLVTRHAADTAQQPVNLVGHSWSWPCAVTVASESDQLRTLVGYVPVAHRGTTETLGRLGLVKATWQELRTNSQPVAREAWSGVAAGAPIALGRILGSSAIQTAIKASARELTDDVIKLSEGGLPVGIVIAQKDAFFGVPTDVRERLQTGGVMLGYIDTTHGGGSSRPEHGVSLYALTEQLLAAPADDTALIR